MNEMHQFDENASEEEVFCGFDAAADDRRSVREYLRERKDGIDVDTVWEGRKAQAVQFAVTEARGLEAEGLPVEAEEYWQLAETLAKETDQNPPPR